MTNEQLKIGFIGTGVMGKSMVQNLLNASYEVNIYTRTKEKATELINNGATWSDSIADLANNVHVVITMVGYPHDVEEVYFGAEGIIENAKSETLIIDMTTSSPKLAKQIYDVAKEKNIFSLDAPVSGGDIGAKNATLAIMVGGDEQAYQKALPIFEVLGNNIVWHGEAGAGQHAKLANQITIASNMIGVCEALIYAKKSGLEPEKVLSSISTGAAGSWSLSNLAPRMIKNDFSPGFFVKHFIKDMTIAVESAKDLEIDMPGLTLALDLYKQLADMGENDSGTQALIKYYDENF
ncbi:MAG TPA: NAD(P)-dependent oxidoreductase [Bacillota bacterium]|nr:NAD(P)-dependent oxidoreductase [Bacillota bacterium]